MLIKKTLLLSVTAASLLVTGCSQTTTKARTAPITAQKTSDGSFTLPNAKSGTCYGKVVIPAQYKTVTEKIQATQADTKLTIINATYKSGTE